MWSNSVSIWRHGIKVDSSGTKSLEGCALSREIGELESPSLLLRMVMDSGSSMSEEQI